MILNRIYYLIPLGHTQLHTRLLPRRHSFSIHRFPQQQGLSSKGDRPGAHNSGAWNTRIFALLSWLYYSRLVSIEAQNYHHCHRANTVSAGALSSNMITQATHKKQVGSSSDATSEQSRNKRVHQSTHQQCSFTRLAVIHIRVAVIIKVIWIHSDIQQWAAGSVYWGLADPPSFPGSRGAERRIQFSRALNRWCSSWRCPHGAAVHRHSPGDTPTPLPHQRGPFRLWSMSAGSPASRVFFRCAPSILFRFCVLF